MKLGMQLGPGPGHIVLDGDPALPSPKKGAEPPSPIFGPFLLWPNWCMHQDAIWYVGRPQPRGLCVRWGPSPLNFQPMFIIVIVISLEHCTMHSSICSNINTLCTVASQSADSGSRNCELVAF